MLQCATIFLHVPYPSACYTSIYCLSCSPDNEAYAPWGQGHLCLTHNQGWCGYRTLGSWLTIKSEVQRGWFPVSWPGHLIGTPRKTTWRGRRMGEEDELFIWDPWSLMAHRSTRQQLERWPGTQKHDWRFRFWNHEHIDALEVMSVDEIIQGACVASELVGSGLNSY